MGVGWEGVEASRAWNLEPRIPRASTESPVGSRRSLRFDGSAGQRNLGSKSVSFRIWKRPHHYLLTSTVDNGKILFQIDSHFQKQFLCLLGFLKVFRNVSGPRSPIRDTENTVDFFSLYTSILENSQSHSFHIFPSSLPFFN